METIQKIECAHGRWLILVPIHNLELTEHINRELLVDRVLFVSGGKIPRIRKRLGLPKPVSDLKKRAFVGQMLTDQGTYAVLQQRGRIRDFKASCLQLIRDELMVLMSSRLGWSRRRDRCRVGLRGEVIPGRTDNLIIQQDGNRFLGGFQFVNNISLQLDDTWKLLCRRRHFDKLLRIINGKVTVKGTWRKQLRHAMLLIGRSWNSGSIADAFLWNMIAMEHLLTHPRESFGLVVPKRLEAILGWCSDWAAKEWEARLDKLYKLRCKLVHGGDDSGILPEHVLFADDVLSNLLTNIALDTTFFASKDLLVQFAEKVHAERVLNIKPRTRPKKRIFISRSYTAKDLTEF